MYGYIYLTTDLKTGLIYVGQKKSKKFLYKNYLGSGKQICKLLEEGATKERFDVKQLDSAENQTELDEKEIFWIKKLDAKNPEVGYNLADGGNTNTGFKQTDYQKQQASTYMSSRIVSKDTRDKMSVSAKSRTENRLTNNGQIWIHNNNSETMIYPEELENYLLQGYTEGKLSINDSDKEKLKTKYQNGTYMIKDNICKFVDVSLIEDYTNEGWVQGRLCYNSLDRNNNISKSKSGTIKIVHIESGKIKYIKPELLESFRKNNFVTSEEYKKKHLVNSVESL